MTMNDLHRIYELEALLAQAFGILLQVDSAVKALKPPAPSRKKMTKSQIADAFDAARKNARKAKSSRQRISEHAQKERSTPCQ